MKKICRILETKIKISKVRPKFRTEKIGREIKKIINYFFIIKRRQKAATSIFDIGFGSDFLVVFASPSAEVIKNLAESVFDFIFLPKSGKLFSFLSSSKLPQTRQRDSKRSLNRKNKNTGD